jgi:hypothetical protein
MSEHLDRITGIQVEGRDFVGLFLQLRKYEEDLDARMMSLLSRMQRVLFSNLTIDEFNRLEESYRSYP